MTAYSDLVLARNPETFHRLDEATGTPTSAIDASGNGRDGTPINFPFGNAPGAIVGEGGTSWRVNTLSNQRIDLSGYTGPTGNNISFECWFKTADTLTGGVDRLLAVWGNSGTTGQFFYLTLLNDNGSDQIAMGIGGGFYRLAENAAINDDAWHHIAVVLGNTLDDIQIYVDGVRVDSFTNGTGSTVINIQPNATVSYLGWPSGSYAEGDLDEPAIYSSRLTEADIRRSWEVGRKIPSSLPTNLDGSAGVVPQASLPTSLDGRVIASLSNIPMRLTNLVTSPLASLPTNLEGFLSSPLANLPMVLNDIDAPPNKLGMQLDGFVTSALSKIPMRNVNQTQSPQARLPTQLQGADVAHFTGSVAKWSVRVDLGGVQQPLSELVEAVEIETSEDASALCTVVFYPPAGIVDPATYERKTLAVTFQGVNPAGAVYYIHRRFTGITQTAIYNPDTGSMTVEATTDLQGILENLPRETIDKMVDGSRWSPHIFDDTADGYQYALDLISTIPSEMHIDQWGYFTVTPWAAKTTPDITLTDGGRFNDSLRVERATRRDLLSQYTINFDFRFNRLRHREISVNFRDQYGFCHWLNNNWRLCSKDMVQSAADGNAWTRTSDITFNTFPPVGTYCEPPRGWVGGADDFCLSAEWRAARRWAQTVTENYVLTVYSPDIEEASGKQDINADYGVEATYDTSDYENERDFEGPPDGSVFNPATGDWEIQATEAEYDGRLAMEDAQEIAVATGEVEILRRARTNVVSLACVYRPDMTLERTVRVDTPYLTAKGKVQRIDETLNVITGELTMDIEIAISRHGGSGFGVTDPQDPPTPPDAPSEDPSERTYTIPYRLGGVLGAQPEQDDWDGYFTNVQESLRDPTGAVYDQKFVVRMPAIEESARNEQTAPQEQTYEIAVPEDELVLRN